MLSTMFFFFEGGGIRNCESILIWKMEEKYNDHLLPVSVVYKGSFV